MNLSMGSITQVNGSSESVRVESIQGSRNGTTASAIPLDIFVLRDVQYKMWKTAFDNR